LDDDFLILRKRKKREGRKIFIKMWWQFCENVKSRKKFQTSKEHEKNLVEQTF